MHAQACFCIQRAGEGIRVSLALICESAVMAYVSPCPGGKALARGDANALLRICVICVESVASAILDYRIGRIYGPRQRSATTLTLDVIGGLVLATVRSSCRVRVGTARQEHGMYWIGLVR